ncbi:hypothetical protein EVAR_45554_1 [Eumeta japonica]|uniref:Uncharacterized protein n=1 Tax=Eumeta variegata TaxID=151549 RepID=A0A4C1XAG5_EUMVA|nr:hypothetical protein EVAR_45554_1 [Eumeta japonica]
MAIESRDGIGNKSEIGIGIESGNEIEIRSGNGVKSKRYFSRVTRQRLSFTLKSTRQRRPLPSAIVGQVTSASVDGRIYESSCALLDSDIKRLQVTDVCTAKMTSVCKTLKHSTLWL